MQSIRLFLCCCLCMVFGSSLLNAQIGQFIPLELEWKGVAQYHVGSDTLFYIDLEDGEYKGQQMPEYVCVLPIYDDAVKVSIELLDVKVASLTLSEYAIAKQYSYLNDFEVKARPIRSRDESILSIRITPFRQRGNAYEKLVSARMGVTLIPDFSKIHNEPKYALQSAMANGKWYKIGLPETGIYKLTYDELNSLGVDVSNIDPRQIRVYHNGGGVLPELNEESRYDDLVEIPIYVAGENDGSFDKNDYILFYARGPVIWRYNADRSAFEHIQNAFEDCSYAFVVTGQGTGKRIVDASSVSASANAVVSQFVDYQVHELDKYNLNRVGRAYFGDKLEGNSSLSLTFDFPNAVTSRSAQIHSVLVGRNFNPASFTLLVDGVTKATYAVPPVSPNPLNQTFAEMVGGWVTANPVGNSMELTLRHSTNSTSTTSDGYVDYISVNAWRDLKFVGPQMRFRNPEASLINKVYEYRLSNATQQVQVWDVTNPVEPKVVKGQLTGETFSFKAMGNQLNEYYAFNGSSYCSAELKGLVDNQNLHSVRDVDFLIVTYPGFMEAAERLMALHNRIDPDLNISITTPEMIYNEFSCGAKDISAIRDFCRMLYLDSTPGHRLKYLLLLGDCSFDYKNRNGIVDFVPTYETEASIAMDETFVTDDFFGCMDQNEGSIYHSLADIGVGRFTVSTLEQANQMVDKVERYVAKDASTLGAWRNVVTFFTDDEGGFVKNAEKMAKMLPDYGGEGIVVDKIYLDAYQQVTSPGGEICPEVNAAINSRMEKGTLVLNYTGHGGEVQLATEKILQRKDVDSWRNAPMYPLMITGTCEFSRYDDHERTSLGEYAFLNQYGGMVAMFTTSRVTYGEHNLNFNTGVYRNLFRITGGELYRLGDVYRMAKTSGTEVEKRYVFFGDPALRLAYPTWSVETTSINGVPHVISCDSVQINDSTWNVYPILHDTLRALQPVVIEGVVKDLSGNVATGFNGMVQVTVYDKEAELSTLGTAADVVDFKLRNSIIFNGKTNVEHGRFSISFIVPRDIAYRFGRGLINYYATDYVVDANGNDDDFIIGGFYDDAFVDNKAPEINLFIDDTLFVSGGLTGENPMLLAFIEDQSGINTTGAGIGHDIIATLSGPSKNSYYLNDYFVSAINNPGKGQITYKMQDLPDGDYTLTLKVWDVYNNSNTATIEFTVVHSDGMELLNPVNWPNPVADETFFTFDHNQVGNNLKVDIYIYDITGRWVTTLSETLTGSSTRIAPIRWNGRGASGEALRNGIYIYRIVATNDRGETSLLVSKLVLSK